MPNQISPDARRANFIVNKEFYQGLEEVAAQQHVSVGELIRRALEKEFPEITVSKPVVQVRVPGKKVVTMSADEWAKMQKLARTPAAPAKAKKKGGKK